LGGLTLQGGAKVQDLADLLGLDHSTLSRTLAPLFKRRWIQRLEGTDRRTTFLGVTPLGRQQAEQAIAAWERFQSELEAALGAARWTRLGADLDAVIALGEPAPEGPRPAKARRSTASTGVRRSKPRR